MFRMGNSVDLDGPLFNRSSCEALMKHATDECAEEVAEWSENAIHDRLHHVLKHPTGYYESNIMTSRIAGGYEVHDNDVVYGPWLEGTGSRNDETRFKGYFTFRLTAQAAEQQADDISEDVLDGYMRRM